MAAKGKRKLIDINDDARGIYAALENFLKWHSIPYTFQLHRGENFRRYYVDSVNLCCAQAVIPALQDTARGRGSNA